MLDEAVIIEIVIKKNRAWMHRQLPEYKVVLGDKDGYQAGDEMEIGTLQVIKRK